MTAETLRRRGNSQRLCAFAVYFLIVINNMLCY